MSETVGVLLKHRGHFAEEVEGQVHAVYRTHDDLVARIDRIANHKDNRRHVMRVVNSTLNGPVAWKIGPDEDEGFFGHKPMWFFAVQSDLLGGDGQ